MIITEATLDALRVQVEAGFEEGYEATETWWQELATEVPSSAASNKYSWIAQQLRMLDWVGDRTAQAIREHDYDIVNQPYEATIQLDRDQVEDDTFGTFVGLTAPQFGEAVRKHPDEKIAELLTGSPVGFDGVTLFSSSHPTFVDPILNPSAATTYDNDLTGSGYALDATGVRAAWAIMTGYTGEDGKPLKVIPDTIFCPPQLYGAALEIANATMTPKVYGSNTAAAAIDNVVKGWFRVVMIPELAGNANRWFLAQTKKRIKPFIYQKRRAPEFVALDRPTDPDVFKRRRLTYGVDYRAGFGVTLPFLIARCYNS